MILNCHAFVPFKNSDMFIPEGTVDDTGNSFNTGTYFEVFSTLPSERTNPWNFWCVKMDCAWRFCLWDRDRFHSSSECPQKMKLQKGFVFSMTKFQILSSISRKMMFFMSKISAVHCVKLHSYHILMWI